MVDGGQRMPGIMTWSRSSRTVSAVLRAGGSSASRPTHSITLSRTKTAASLSSPCSVNVANLPHGRTSLKPVKM